MIAERARASETPSDRDRADATGRLASARRRTIGVVERISAAATEWTGHTSAFAWALVLVIGWTITGPLFRYSDTWQLFINTVTNLVTFLMVFLIQRAQNKDTLALQLKVNELIAAQKGAHNSLIAIEQFSEHELRTLHERFLRLAEVAHGGGVTSVATVPSQPGLADAVDANAPVTLEPSIVRSMSDEPEALPPERSGKVIPMPGAHPPDGRAAPLAAPSDAGTIADRRMVDVRGVALTVLMILASLLALQWARPLLVPILLGILFSYALDPMVRRLVQWRVPHATAVMLVFAGTLSAVVVLGYALSHPLAAVADRLPSAAQEFREAIQSHSGGAPGPVAKVQQAANELQKLSGAETPAPGAPPKVATVAIEKKPFDLGDYLWQGSMSVTAFLGETVVVLFLALYLLLAGDTFRRRFVEIAGPTLSHKKITLHILDAISLQISRYLFVRSVISGIVGIGTFAAFWGVGLAEPIVWGVGAGLLNVIPYVGPLTVTAAAGVAAFVQFHSASMAALTAGLAAAVACVEAYAITPLLMSRTAEMNPAAVFIGLAFWGFLWGLPGLFLAVPIIMVLKSVSDHVEALQPLATLLKR